MTIYLIILMTCIITIGICTNPLQTHSNSYIESMKDVDLDDKIVFINENMEITNDFATDSSTRKRSNCNFNEDEMIEYYITSTTLLNVTDQCVIIKRINKIGKYYVYVVLSDNAGEIDVFSEYLSSNKKSQNKAITAGPSPTEVGDNESTFTEDYYSETVFSNLKSIYNRMKNYLFGLYTDEYILKKLTNSPQTCRLSYSRGVNKGYESGFFSWGVDRLDQKNNLLDNIFCVPYKNEGEGIDIYIVDSGVNSHLSFKNKSNGYSYYDDTSNSNNDCNGHGTHVAGLAASKIYGIAPKANIISVKVLNCDGSGDFASLFAGLSYIYQRARSGKSIVNLSLGAQNAQSEPIEDIINDLRENKGIPVVVSSGNFQDDACSTFPASIESVITVASTDPMDKKPFYSNYGSCVDIFAPGSSLISCSGINSTSIKSGTSMSAGLVSGCLALYMSELSYDLNGNTMTRFIKSIKDKGIKNILRNVGTNSPNILIYTGIQTDTQTPLPSPGIDTPSQEEPTQSSEAVSMSVSGGNSDYNIIKTTGSYIKTCVETVLEKTQVIFRTEKKIASFGGAIKNILQHIIRYATKFQRNFWGSEENKKTIKQDL